MQNSGLTATRGLDPRKSHRPYKNDDTSDYRDLATVLDEIDRAESLVVELTAKLADSSTYLDGGKEVASFTAALESAKQEVIRLTQRWEQLESKKEGDV